MHPSSSTRLFLPAAFLACLSFAVCNFGPQAAYGYDDNLATCTRYARNIVDLGENKHRLIASQGDRREQAMRADEQKRINRESNEYRKKIESLCPGTGFECRTYLKAPEKNSCIPFKIQTDDKLIIRNNTYE